MTIRSKENAYKKLETETEQNREDSGPGCAVLQCPPRVYKFWRLFSVSTWPKWLEKSRYS